MIYLVDAADVAAINAELPAGHAIPITVVEGSLYFDDDASLAPLIEADVDAAVAASPLAYQTLAGWIANEGTVASYAINPYLANGHGPFFHEPPYAVNYNTGLTTRFERLITDVDKGEVREVIYYLDLARQPDGSVVPSTPMVKEATTYVRTGDGLADSRVTRITWYRADGTEDTANFKDLPKTYVAGEQVDEGRKRRALIIDEAAAGIIYLLNVTVPADAGTANIDKAKALWADHKTAIELYVDTSANGILADILADATHAWLDNVIDPGPPAVDIRAWLHAELDIWA